MVFNQENMGKENKQLHGKFEEKAWKHLKTI